MARTPALLLLLIAATPVDGAELRLPFTGKWFVYQGGDTPNVNHHMAVRAQWYAVDFVKVGGPDARALSSPDPKALDDFYCWGARVLAPVAGEVVRVVGDLPDNPLGTKDRERPAGNHVVLATADGQFVFLAHFQRASVSVSRGARVAAGDALGRCGNSGNSDFPHVHLHVQDTLDATATGQNPVFSHMDVELTDKRFENVTWPLIRGLFVTARNADQE